ncbi:MAG: sugar ABC transporter ATP-binding protein [Terrimicrobiaceae bacterium]
MNQFQKSAKPPVLQMRNISKSFGAVRVLTNVQLEVRKSEIHALMGENGAGKSTLMKIASGLISSYEGEVFVEGERVHLASPRDASRHGISIIHQELSLVPELHVDENIFLGQERLRSFFFVDRRSQIKAAREVLAQLDFRGSIETPVSKLRVGEQQLIEIAKALASKARILIMDEPTSALSINESQRLFEVIRRLVADGVAIVYISHRMEEVFSLADVVTVLRDGNLVGTLAGKEATRRDLIRMMVGRELQDAARVEKVDVQSSGAVLEVRNLWLENPTPTPSREKLVAGVNFTVGQGEILGIGGLLGAGRTETLQVLFGLHPGTSGAEVKVKGKPVKITSPVRAKAVGIAMVTEDRKGDGLVLDATITRNVALPVTSTLCQFGIVRADKESGLAKSTMKKLNVAAFGPDQAVGSLSGGNQQKVVLGKWLATLPSVLMLDEPTRGIDVGAKAEIYRLVRELASEGLAIILVSSELPELTLLSDRILVMREGRPTAILDPSNFSHETILEFASPGGATQPEFESLDTLS